ncbi:MAG TPA: NADH-quinone oxidoreductase subunit J, partial [Opitutus sp.]|nr:NADH-quinone oxidoreductase subunit J [Opitutus sp.]
MPHFLFNFFALLTVISAVGAVLNKNTVNAAMCFMLSLIGVAGLFVLLDAYLLAFVLLLVYAGAVAALFLFIVMLLDMKGGERKPFTPLTIAASTVAAALLTVGVLMIYQQPVLAAAAAENVPGASLKEYAY